VIVILYLYYSPRLKVGGGEGGCAPGGTFQRTAFRGRW